LIEAGGSLIIRHDRGLRQVHVRHRSKRGGVSGLIRWSLHRDATAWPLAY